jgi:hypothetical protein
MRDNAKSQQSEKDRNGEGGFCVGRVVKEYKCRQWLGAEEIGTLRFGWLEKVAGRDGRLGAAQNDSTRTRVPENLKLIESRFLVNSNRSI